MKIEFIKDSRQLQTFVNQLNYIDTIIDWGEEYQVFRHNQNGKYYLVEIGYQGKFAAYLKYIEGKNRYVVTFSEVKRIVITKTIKIIDWKEVE